MVDESMAELEMQIISKSAALDRLDRCTIQVDKERLRLKDDLELVAGQRLESSMSKLKR